MGYMLYCSMRTWPPVISVQLLNRVSINSMLAHTVNCSLGFRYDSGMKYGVQSKKESYMFPSLVEF